MVNFLIVNHLHIFRLSPTWLWYIIIIIYSWILFPRYLLGFLYQFLFSCSVVSDSLNPVDCSMPGFPVHHQLLELAQTHVHWLVKPSNYLILCRPLLLLPSIFPRIRVFSNESVLPIKWPKYWNFSFSINSSSEYSGLISFRFDWLDLLAVQGTVKSLFQYYSLKE